MAKLTEAQKRSIQEEGFLIETFERLDQSIVDKTFPPEGGFISYKRPEPPRVDFSAYPAATVTQPPTPSWAEGLPKPAQPIVPVVEPSAAVGMPEASPVSPIIKTIPTKPVYPFVPPPTPELGRQVKQGQSLTSLADAYVKSRSTTPEGKVDAELEKQARERAEYLLATKFTPGGEAGPITALLRGAFTPEPGSIGEALLPQVIATPEEAGRLKKDEFEASINAVDQLAKEYQEDIDKAVRELGPAAADTIDSLQAKKDLLDTAPLRSGDFLRRKQQLLEYRALKREALFSGKPLPPFNSNYKDSTTFDNIKAGAVQVGMDIAGGLFTRMDPGAGIVETPVGYAGRLLGAPVSGIVGAVEAATTAKDLGPAVAGRVREGLGVMGAGIDISDAAIEASGLPEDSTAATVSRYIGGGAGLIIDFLLPIVPGAGSATAGTRALVQTLRIEKALEPAKTTASVTKTALANAARAAAGEAGRAIPFASKYISPEYGTDIYSRAITRFSDDTTNIKSMEDLLVISERLDGDELKAFAAKAPDEKLEELEKIWQTEGLRLGDETWEQAQVRLGKIADITDDKVYKRYRKIQPDIIKRATLDKALTPETKAKIARGSTYTSEELAKEVISYLQRVEARALDDTSIVARKLLPDLRPGEELNSLLEKVASGSLGKGFLKEEAILKQYLRDIGSAKLTDSLLQTKRGAAAFPDYIRLTRNSFVPKELTTSIVREYADLIGPLRDKVAGAKGFQTDVSPQLVAIEKAELEMLVDYLGPTSLRYLPEEAKGAIDTILAEIISTAEGNKYFITPQQYNGIAERLLDAVASNKPGYKSAFDIGEDIRRMQASPGIDKIFKEEAYFKKVLTPKEVAGGTLETVVKATTKRSIDNGAPNYSEVLSKEFAEEVGQRWGSINENFKSKYRQARAEGLSAPDAWSKVIVNNYLVEAQTTIRELEAIKSVRPEDAAEILGQIEEIRFRNYEQMFDDYISMMYGGFESVIEAYNTTGRTLFIDKMMVPPFEMRKLIFVMSEHPFLKELKATFVREAMAGSNGAALTSLRNAHAIIQGRGINSFIKNAGVLEKMFEAAKRSDPNVVLGEIPFKTGGARQGERGIFEIFNYAKETAPMFFVDDHLELLSAQYLARRQAGIIAETYNEWSRIMPELFPTSRGINENVERFRDLLSEHIVGPYAGSSSFINKVISEASEADAMIPVSRPRPLAQAGGDQTTLGRLSPEQFDSLAKDRINRVINSFEAEGTLDQILIEGTEANLQFKKLLQDDPEVARGLEILDPVSFNKLYSAPIDTLAEPISLILKEASEAGKGVKEIDTIIQDELIRILRGPGREELAAIEAAAASAKKKGKAPPPVPDLKQIYIKLVEDRLTSLSSSEAKGRAYSNYIATLRIRSRIAKEIISNLEKAGVTMDKTITNAAYAYAKELHRNLFFSSNSRRYWETFSGSDDYVRSIYPKLRQEDNALFYDTLKTSIRQAAKSNLEVITRGPIEQVQTIPLTFGETSRIKGQLLARGGLEQYTEAMDELAVSSTVRKEGLLDKALAKELEEAIEKGLQATSGLRSAAEKGTAIVGKRFLNIVGEVVGSPSALFNDGKVARLAKSGVLGGLFLPNFRYFMSNYLTAPAIIYGSIGKVVGPQVVFDPRVNSVMKAQMGGSGIGGITGAIDVRMSPTPVKVETVVISPTGKVYTNYDIADILRSQSIARSQASAELTNNVIQDIVSFTSAGTKRNVRIILDSPATIPELKYLSRLEQSSKSLAKKMLLDEPAKGLQIQEAPFYKRWLGLSAGSRQMNIYNEIGNMSDTMFRSKVLMNALEEGLSEQAAITLARESLFDYGNLSKIEKEYISKMFWFWTFRRNSYRQVIKSFLTNPARMKNAYVANGYLAEMDRDYNISTKDYAEYRPFLHLTTDKENKQRYGLYGPSIPQLDATAQLIDYLSLGLPLLNPSLTLGGSLKEVAVGVTEKAGEMASPPLQTAIGLYFGVDIRRDAQELGYGIDPRLMAYLVSNPEMWETFQVFVNVEVVPPEDEKPGKGTYQGRQWRIRKGDQASVRNWFAIQQAMLGLGIQRSIRDYATAGAPLAGLAAEMATGTPTPEPLPTDVRPIQMGGQREEGSTMLNLLYMLGVVTPIEQPPLQDQIEFNKKVLAEEFREGTYK